MRGEDWAAGNVRDVSHPISLQGGQDCQLAGLHCEAQDGSWPVSVREPGNPGRSNRNRPGGEDCDVRGGSSDCETRSLASWLTEQKQRGVSWRANGRRQWTAGRQALIDNALEVELSLRCFVSRGSQGRECSELAGGVACTHRIAGIGGEQGRRASRMCSFFFRAALEKWGCANGPCVNLRTHSGESTIADAPRGNDEIQTSNPCR